MSWFYATIAASQSLVGLPALTPRVANSASMVLDNVIVNLAPPLLSAVEY